MAEVQGLEAHAAAALLGRLTPLRKTAPRTVEVGLLEGLVHDGQTGSKTHAAAALLRRVRSDDSSHSTEEDNGQRTQPEVGTMRVARRGFADLAGSAPAPRRPWEGAGNGVPGRRRGKAAKQRECGRTPVSLGRTTGRRGAAGAAPAAHRPPQRGGAPADGEARADAALPRENDGATGRSRGSAGSSLPPSARGSPGRRRDGAWKGQCRQLVATLSAGEPRPALNQHKANGRACLANCCKLNSTLGSASPGRHNAGTRQRGARVQLLAKNKFYVMECEGR